MDSSRHHYIPQYYIKGFVDTDGLIFVYDKIKEKIIGKKSPKSIFFEWDRNTIFTNIGRNSIIEEKMYGYTDSYCAPAFEWYRDQSNTDKIHGIENSAKLKAFAVNLYWRLPANDGLFEDCWLKGKFADSNKELLEAGIIDEETRKKLIRSNLDVDSFNEARAQSNNEMLYQKLFDFGRPMFLLGDSPVVYETPPKTFDKIVYSELTFAVSSSRAFFEMETNGLNFDDTLAYSYNVAVIDQSMQYICSPNEDLLLKSIEHYKTAKRQQLLPLLRHLLFKRITSNINT